MSKLIVKVEKISKIYKHPNADKLSIIEMEDNGWNCIVGLNQYKAGDLIIYCPPDCIIPKNIIEKCNLEYLKKDGRVKTVKLRGYISQGLVLDICSTVYPNKITTKWKEGTDVAKYLGITKYKPPVSCNLGIKGRKPTKKKQNPLFDKYTDIENIKNYNTVFKDGDGVIITEKLHGTSFRAGKLLRYKENLWGKIKSFLFGKYEFVYGSHNVQLTGFNKKKKFYGEDVYGRIAKKYNLAEIIPEDYVVYAELYGKNIQELEYGLLDIEFAIFDIKYKGKYLDWEKAEYLAKLWGLPIVPILYKGKYHDEIMKTFTEGDSILSKTKQIREGYVIKSIKEENHPRIGRKILKSINPEYLLKKNRTEYH